MADWEVTEGDYGFNQNFVITDSSGAAFDLTTYGTITLKAWDVTNTQLFTGTCTSASPTGGTCTYLVGTTNFATPGDYYARIILTKATEQRSTKIITLKIRNV